MLNFKLMIGNPNTLAVLLKEVSKAKDFEDFSRFVFQLFDWLKADAVFLRIEEFNKKYYKTYFKHFPNEIIRTRIPKGEEESLIKKVYPKIDKLPFKPMVISVNKPEVNHVEVQVFWKENTDFERLRAEIELLHPVLTIKMEQLQLAQNLSKYEQMLANSMDVMMLIERNELEYVSPQAQKFMGYSIEELRDAILSRSILSPDDREDVKAKILEDEKRKRQFSKREYRIKLKNGSYKWIEWVVRRIFDDHGDVVRMILNFRDITDKKTAEEELEHQKAYLQEILDRLPIDIFMKDQSGTYIFANSTAAQTVNLEMQDLIGKSDTEIFDPETAKQNQSTDKRVFEGEVISEIHTVQKNNKEAVLLTNKQAVKVEDRQVILGYSVDITEQQTNERKLKESTEFINRSLQIVPDSIFIFDLENWSYVFTNNKIFDKLGYRNSDIEPDLKTFIGNIIHSDDVNTYFAQMSEIRQGRKEIFELEYRVFDKSGNTRWLFSRKAPIKKDKKGRVQQYVGITFDITDQTLRE
jgi:PAS domain S-box-containing protein